MHDRAVIKAPDPTRLVGYDLEFSPCALVLVQ
jgi:hypothetical protein